MARSHPTIEDVARLAGVSLATVSRALRGLPHVRPEVRARVQAAADELRYVADPNASRLASGRTRTIGLITPILNTWYASAALAGLEDELQASGYDLLISALSSPKHRRDLLDGLPTFHQRVDGIVAVDMFFGTRRPELPFSTPMVVVGEQLTGAPSLAIDNHHGGVLAGRHLVERGHRDIALVSGFAPLTSFSPVPRMRREGFLQALAEAGVEAMADVDGEFSVEGGRRAAHQLLDAARPPTALFCMSDEMGFGVLWAARERGLSVPGDLAVIGFDGHPMAAAVGLSTVWQPVRELGRRSAQLILRLLDDPAADSGHEEFDVQLIVRESTAPATPAGAS